MHFSFPAVNENADKNELSLPILAEKKTKTVVTCAYITELKLRFSCEHNISAQRKWDFWNENEK